MTRSKRPLNVFAASLAFTEAQKRHSVRGFRCEACGLTFRSVTGFDAHRVERYASDGKPNNRRCLSPKELENRGYQQNAAGQWTRTEQWAKAA